MLDKTGTIRKIQKERKEKKEATSGTYYFLRAFNKDMSEIGFSDEHQHPTSVVQCLYDYVTICFFKMYVLNSDCNVAPSF